MEKLGNKLTMLPVPFGLKNFLSRLPQNLTAAHHGDISWPTAFMTSHSMDIMFSLKQRKPREQHCSRIIKVSLFLSLLFYNLSLYNPIIATQKIYLTAKLFAAHIM